MSIYAQVISTGVQALAGMADPEGTAAYADAYNNAAQRFRLASAKNTAEKNISAVRQDKILTNTKIQLQATQAEAIQKVQNAVSGRTGASVNDVSGEIQKTANQMIQANSKEAKQKEESLLAAVNESQASLLSVRDREDTFAAGMMEVFSAFEFSDLKLGNDILDKLSTDKKGKK